MVAIGTPEVVRNLFPKNQGHEKFNLVTDYLQDELGLIFFEKWPTHYPEVSNDKLRAIFKLKSNTFPLARIPITNLTTFLKSNVIGDKFGTNYNERAEKTSEVLKRLSADNTELANFFTKIYISENQLTLNNLFSVTLSINALAMLAEKADLPGLAEKLNHYEKELVGQLNGQDSQTAEKKGKSFNEIESPEEKFEITKHFEDKIIEVLKLLGGV